jgi:hypothetical protein
MIEQTHQIKHKIKAALVTNSENPSPHKCKTLIRVKSKAYKYTKRWYLGNLNFVFKLVQSVV